MARPITLFTGQWADLPLEEVAKLASGWGYDGLELACWGDHLDPWRWDERRLRRGQARAAREVQPQGLGDLEPPQGPGRLRRPDRRAPPRHPLRPGVGRRRPRGRAPARRRGDEAHRAPRREARREDRHRLHRLVDLEVRRDVPAGLAGDDRRRLPGLRRPLEPDPRRLRRGRRALRARGAPERDRVRLLDHRAHARGDRAPPGVRPQLGPEPHGVAGPRPGRVPLGLPRPDLPRGLQGHQASAWATAATAGSARTSRGPTRAAAGTSSRPATATCRGRTRSACSTRSATTARSRSSGRTPAWTA